MPAPVEYTLHVKLFPFTGLLLNPMIAGAAMALSSFTVVNNANRLRWFKA